MSFSDAPTPPYLPRFRPKYEQEQGPVSLALSLFRLAPPEVAMEMMRQKWITDLNERTADGVSLLAVKAQWSGGGSINIDMGESLPSWDDWSDACDAHKDVWSLSPPADTLRLLSGMIYAGADPWVEWDASSFDGVCDRFPSLMCLKRNASMVRLLLSHPACPDASTFDAWRLENTKLSHDYNSYNSPLKNQDTPWLHYVVNTSDTDLLDLLLKKGLDVNQKDAVGRTPIFYALDKEIVKTLIAHGAHVDIKDTSGNSLSGFWKSTIATAAKQAEFNSLVIEKLKTSITGDELRVIQGPELLAQVLKGTKSGFEAIYRKSKFTPAVLFDRGAKGTWNLITAGLLASNEKSDLFLRMFTEKKVSWEHKPWSSSTVDNAVLATVINPHYSALHHLRTVRYANMNPPDLLSHWIKDQWQCLALQGQADLRPLTALTHWMALFFVGREDILSDRANDWTFKKTAQDIHNTMSNLCRGVEYKNRTWKPSEDPSKPCDIRSIAPFVQEEVTRGGMPLAHAGILALQGVLTRQSKNAAKNSKGLSLPAVMCKEMLPIIVRNVEKNIPGWIDIAVLFAAATSAIHPEDKEPYGQKKTSDMGNIRSALLAALASAPSGSQLGLSEQQASLASQAFKKAVQSETSQNLMAWMSQKDISQALADSGLGEQPSVRRRM